MQLQNPFFNFSKESKQVNSTIDNNSSNSINLIISPNNKNNYLNKNKEQIEEKEKNNSNINLELIKKNNLKFNKITDMEKKFAHNIENKNFIPNNNDNSNSKTDENLEENFIDFNPNNQNIENNNNDNIDDVNFFNFCFYNNNNNKNNNKDINNNYNKKIIENNNYDKNNDTLKTRINDEDSKNNTSKSPKHINAINKSTIKKFDQSKIKKDRCIFFSIENADSNFRKKSNNYQLKVRSGDWICPKCENLNFAFRNKCNRCGLPKENIEQNNNHLQISDNNSDNNRRQRPILFNNININYIFNSIFPINNINIINNPIIMNNTNINNYYGNYNNYQIYYPCNVNIK